MVRSRMMLGVIITQVLSTRGPVDYEVPLCAAITHPIKTHVDRVHPLLLNSVINNSASSGVVSHYGCGV
eukprot:10652343-Ditylum_brightwellii.AAC.1